MANGRSVAFVHFEDCSLTTTTTSTSSSPITTTRKEILQMVDRSSSSPVATFISDPGRRPDFTSAVSPKKTPSRQVSISLTGDSPKNGDLLESVTSMCLCCGQEVVDPKNMPDILNIEQVRLPPEVYCDVIRDLMRETKFTYHVWCYNMPLSITVISILLGLCFATVLLAFWILEIRAHEHSRTEYIVAMVIWSVLLIIHIVLVNVSKWMMKKSTRERLDGTNRTLSKYNLMVGLEDLGWIDCNKYKLHFYYYEVGLCLEHLQETYTRKDEVDMVAYFIQADTRTDDGVTSGVTPGMPYYATNDFMVDVEAQSDRKLFLNRRPTTNRSLQAKTEDLFFRKSAEYISQLEKLENPQVPRHIKNRPCLCQYLEDRNLLDELLQTSATTDHRY